MSNDAMPLNEWAEYCRSLNYKWWHEIDTGMPLERNKGELMMLMVSEIAEALEGVRKNLKDDHLPQYKSEHVELADLFIRLMDYMGEQQRETGCNFDEIVRAKLAYNRTRKDHTHEHRKGEHGKRF